jgi:hypothetical protein
MRTTLTIDDDLAEQLQHVAATAREPLKSVVNRALRLGLERMRPRARRRRTVQKTYRMGYPASGSLDKALRMAAWLEDEDAVRKLGLGR